VCVATLDFLVDALFVLADLADADLVDLLADLTLGALALADLVLAFDSDFFLLPSTSVSGAEALDFLLPLFDASTAISPFLVLFFSDPPFTLRDFVDFLD
jgi:hypothetical protein